MRTRGEGVKNPEILAGVIYGWSLGFLVRHEVVAVPFAAVALDVLGGVVHVPLGRAEEVHQVHPILNQIDRVVIKYLKIQNIQSIPVSYLILDKLIKYLK